MLIHRKTPAGTRRCARPPAAGLLAALAVLAVTLPLAALLCAPAAFAQTVTLAASDVEDDTATLTISGHTGDWYHKYTVPTSPAGTCSTVVSAGTDTASLASLVTATSYTFKAYSDNQCNTALTSDANDAEFLTKPGQVTGVSARPGNASLLVRWTALSGTVTGYRVQWRTQSQSYDATRQKTVTHGASTTITDLNNGTQYWLRVTAWNATGDGAPSSESLHGPKSPALGFAGTVADQSYTEGSAVNVTLPAGVAQGTCSGAFTYHLTPDLPAGLSFNAGTRLISGTPTTAFATTEYTYLGYDNSCYDTAATTFDVTVAATPDIRLSRSSVSLTEGGAGQTYTVRLKSAPAGDVTVAVASGDTGAVTASPASLTFSATNYDTARTVTLSAVQDADGVDETVTVTHTASGGLVATETLTAAVTDDDRRITLSPTSLDVPEGTSGTYTVALAAAPSDDVSVEFNLWQLTGVSLSPASLTFTTSNSSAPQTVTVTATNDQAFNGNLTQLIRHTATGGGYGAVTADLTVFTADDENPGLVVSPATLTLIEGGNAGTFTVRMGGNMGAGATATVSVASSDGDGGAATVSPTSLTFQRHNATANQTVTVTPVQDADVDDESVTVTMTVSGSSYDRETGTVTVSVLDDEAAVLAAGAVTRDSATLTLTNHTGDWYYKRTVPATPADTCSTRVDGGTKTVSLADLTAGTSYTYKAYRDPNCANEITNDGTDADLLTKPGQVTGLAVTSGAVPGDPSLALSWTAPGGTVTGYKLQWRSGAERYDGATRQSTVPGAPGATIGSVTGAITGLTIGTTYTVRVTAYNATGDGAVSAEASGTPAVAVPAPPTILAVSEGDAGATLSWTAGADGGTAVTRWEVRHKAGGGEYGAWTAVPGSGAGTRRHTVTGLANGVVHRFKVRAVNGAGDGAASAESAAVTPAAFCGRTPAVRDAIVARAPGKATCSAVTTTDLAGVTGKLDLSGKGIGGLTSGDFAGLTGVTQLDLSGNGLTSLPAGLFDPLTALTTLTLADNDLTDLPAGLFDRLTGLTDLSLPGNALTSLPAGVFDRLTALTSLDLGTNRLTSLPAGLFDGTAALATLWLDANRLATPSPGVFDRLASLTSLYMQGNPLSCLPSVPASVTTYRFEGSASGYAACGAGVTASRSGVSAGAGASKTYTLALAAAPNRFAGGGAVTITTTSGDATTATVSPATLVFGPDNWSTPQAVTVTGVAAGSAVIGHAVAGGGYGAVTVASVTAAVTAVNLAASAVTDTTATLTIAGHTGTWYHKRTVPGRQREPAPR